MDKTEGLNFEETCQALLDKKVLVSSDGSCENTLIDGHLHYRPAGEKEWAKAYETLGTLDVGGPYRIAEPPPPPSLTFEEVMEAQSVKIIDKQGHEYTLRRSIYGGVWDLLSQAYFAVAPQAGWRMEAVES